MAASIPAVPACPECDNKVFVRELEPLSALQLLPRNLGLCQGCTQKRLNIMACPHHALQMIPPAAPTNSMAHGVTVVRLDIGGAHWFQRVNVCCVCENEAEYICRQFSAAASTQGRACHLTLCQDCSFKTQESFSNHLLTTFIKRRLNQPRARLDAGLICLDRKLWETYQSSVALEEAVTGLTIAGNQEGSNAAGQNMEDLMEGISTE